MTDLTLRDAAKRIGVSVDTLRRWAAAGKLSTSRDARNRRLVPAAEVERLAPHPDRHRVGDTLSARNRFPGGVTSVDGDGGLHRITAAITRDAVEELDLRPGVNATAAVKATSVMVERS